MATSLALQLSKIAAHSTHSLNPRVQRISHSQSLLFDPDVAVKQDFSSLYLLCLEGYEELCNLDRRFVSFGDTIFGEESKDQERTQMTSSENETLDNVLEDFLRLVGARLLLKPAAKAVEWLVRRFRVHEFNTSCLLLTFLPFHTTSIFQRLLSIMPSEVPHALRFIRPYVVSRSSPPRHAIVYSLINNHALMSAFNNYVLEVCRADQHHHMLLTFWAGAMTEAVSGTLDLARSGRRSVQMQNEQDVLIRLLPILSEGLAFSKIPDVRLGCYMVIIILATKASLGEDVSTTMMKAVAAGWTGNTASDGLICLALLAESRTSATLPGLLFDKIAKVKNLIETLEHLATRYPVGKLALILALGKIERFKTSENPADIEFVERLLGRHLLSDTQLVSVVKSVLLLVQSSDGNRIFKGGDNSRIKASLGLLLGRLYRSEDLSPKMAEALRSLNRELEPLALNLQISFREKSSLDDPVADTEMADAGSPPDMANQFEAALRRLSARTEDAISFLSTKTSDAFTDLVDAFLLAVDTPSNIDIFCKTSLLAPNSALQQPLFLSFFIRIWCGSYPAMVRSVALRIVSQLLSSQVKKVTDFQALIPYVIVALSDPSKMVRQAAAETVLSCCKVYARFKEGKEKTKRLKPWGFNGLYDETQQDQAIKWIKYEDGRAVIEDLLVLSLEECVLDSARLGYVIRMAASDPASNSTKPEASGTPTKKFTQRTALVSLLATHAVHTPLLSVRLRLLRLLNWGSLTKSGSKTKMLLPVLQNWMLQSLADVSTQCAAEGINMEDISAEVTAIVTSGSAEGLAMLQAIIAGQTGSGRADLFMASMNRVKVLWLALPAQFQNSMSEILLKLSLGKIQGLNDHQLRQLEARNLLRSLKLSAEVLATFINQLPAAVQAQEGAGAAKRRRTGQDKMLPIDSRASGEAAAAVEDIAFVLELIDSSKPAAHSLLMKSLFNLLGELQQYKTQVGAELAYVQALVLGSLLVIVKSLTGPTSTKIDFAMMRTDFVVDCLRSTSSQQVQNGSLLLMAHLADIAPNLVLHTVMPIFTFVSSTMLRQDDEYSIYVIDQTIDHVIPSLVRSLKSKDVDHVTGTAGLLLTFTAAFEHVPKHRRMQLYTLLLKTLGVDDFLFVLLTMLANKFGKTVDVQAFAVELSARYGPLAQLEAVDKILDVILDILSPNRSFSSVLLGADNVNTGDPEASVQRLLLVSQKILSSNPLKSQLTASRLDAHSPEVKTVLSRLLDKFTAFVESSKNREQVHDAAIDTLNSVIALLSTKQFIHCVEALLDASNKQPHWKLLRALKTHLEKNTPADQDLLAAIANFIPRLASVLKGTSDVSLKHAAIACLDTIIEKQGRRDTGAAVAAVQVIAGPDGLGQDDVRVRTISLLCLTSAVETLGPESLPFLPMAISKALDNLEACLGNDGEPASVHNAVYSLLGALFIHVPWFITSSLLDRVLTISHKSAKVVLDNSAHQTRLHVLRLMARQVTPDECFATLQRNITSAIANGPRATQETISILGFCIEKHSKSTVIKHAPSVANTLLEVFDLRRMQALELAQQFGVDDVDEIERRTQDLVLKMILKLNDTSFRPIFAKFVEWATTGLRKKDRKGRVLRQITLYHLLEKFFATLKSLVTSYASHIIENVVYVLTRVSLDDIRSRTLWAAVLRTLRTNFEFDQDGFWQSPSHFNAIRDPLLAQLGRGTEMPTVDEVVPAIAELAAAVESGDHHKEMNTAIMKHLRSDNPHVRLAAIKCEEALTARLGEDWLALLPEMLPFVSELQEDDDEDVERETHRWIVQMEGILGENLDAMLQ